MKRKKILEKIMKNKSSEDWQKICHATILDPDGWDRLNFQESWNEKISRVDFENRMVISTVQMSVSWISCIWKDQPYRSWWHVKMFTTKIWRWFLRKIKSGNEEDKIIKDIQLYITGAIFLLFFALFIIGGIIGIVEAFL